MATFVMIAFTGVLTALLTLGAWFLKKKGVATSIYTKSAALTLLGLTFARYIFDQPPVYFVHGLKNDLAEYAELQAAGGNAALTVLAILLVWFAYAAMMTTVISEFYKSETLSRIVSCFSAPVYLIALALFGIYSEASLGLLSDSLSTVRLWIMAAEIAVALSIPIAHALLDRSYPIPKTKREVGGMLYALLFAVLAIMPCWAPQALIGDIDPTLQIYGISEEHRFMIYMAVVTPYLIFRALRNKSQDAKRVAMVYMVLAFFWAYIGRWNVEMLSDPLEWPLHLCNTAMFLFPLCLVFKLEKLFNFTLFINVLGALLAMLMPWEMNGTNALGTERVSFWLNHHAAFFIPLLLVALGLFKRPKFKEWVYSVIALSVYFVAILFINAWFSNYGECDFFFLNSDFIVSKLGLWAEKTLDITFSFNIGELSFTFYPLYQFLFYLVYLAITVGIWFLYALLFTMWDASADRRNREKDYKKMKKELHDYLGDRPEYLPKTGDDTPHLVIKNFSKRYGTNNHYSVKNVSLDVKGGEIFGFLGPNGAGKSTIIKSIVGIQTITEGNIEICGYDVESQAPHAKLHLGFVPDHYALYENLTGREYINYIADLYSITEEYRNEVIEKLVKRFQLTGSFDNQMKTYSHGMKQKITIMSALVHNPKVWILDEPLTGLDPTSIFEVKECMKEHAAKGNVVFFSSHIIDLVEKLCDRIAIIKKGQLRASASIKELSEKGIELERFYLDTIASCDDEHVPYVESSELKKEAKGESV